MSDTFLEPNYWSINQLFRYRFKVPVYQRPYSWQAEQIDSLLDDIKKAYEEYKPLDEAGRHKVGLYVGNIILHRRSFELFDIIDGQQRITTFALILLALYAKLHELNCDPKDRIMLKLQQALWKLNSEEEPVKELRTIELGSVEKEIMINVFDAAFASPKTLSKYISRYTTTSSFQKNVKDNYARIITFISGYIANEDDQTRELLSFSNFVLNKVNIISIQNGDSEFKAFSVFESINSKGKRLEDIDLIKTLIFSRLDETDYSTYLANWGDLIVKTNDGLYDYLKIFIRANIKYYTNNITFNNFRKMDYDLCQYYGTETIAAAYKDLIDDMIDKVQSFKALFNLADAMSIVNDNQLKFFYSVFLKIGYEHPRPLFFRCFCEYQAGNLSKADLLTIIIETIKYCMSFLTIMQKDSKDAISVFSTIMSSVYSSSNISKDYALYQINTKLKTAGVREADILAMLKHLDLYEKNKQLGAAILSLYESQYTKANGEIGISWDEAFSKYSSYGESYSLDHILNQTPSIDDPNLKYYKLGNNLKLKDGHDFPDDIVYDGMEYDTFKRLILHRAGNLRLKGGDGNASRGNASETSFSTYKKLNGRNNKIAEFIMNYCLQIEQVSSSYNPETEAGATRQKPSGNFDFSMTNIDLTGCKVKAVSIEDKTFPVDKNKDILIHIVEYFCETKKDQMIALAADAWKPRRRLIISSSPDEMTTPFEVLQNAIYVETNLSSRDILFYAEALITFFGIDNKRVSIYIPE